MNDNKKNNAPVVNQFLRDKNVRLYKTVALIVGILLILEGLSGVSDGLFSLHHVALLVSAVRIFGSAFVFLGGVLVTVSGIGSDALTENQTNFFKRFAGYSLIVVFAIDLVNNYDTPSIFGIIIDLMILFAAYKAITLGKNKKHIDIYYRGHVYSESTFKDFLISEFGQSQSEYFVLALKGFADRCQNENPTCTEFSLRFNSELTTLELSTGSHDGLSLVPLFGEGHPELKWLKIRSSFDTVYEYEDGAFIKVSKFDSGDKRKTITVSK